VERQNSYYAAHGQAYIIVRKYGKMLKIIQLLAVMLAACTLGNWYLSEYKKARSAGLPLYRAYFSLPGVLIILLIILLPLFARLIHK
jgi:hypothetical protein